MKYYFHLQLQRIMRWFDQNGLPRILGFSVAISAFVLASAYLFYKFSFAVYLYSVLALYLPFQLAKKERKESIGSFFKVKEFIKLRLVENIIVIMPFVIFLAFKLELIAALIVFLAGVGLSFLNWKSISTLNIWTPFKKYPFEFIVGFRKTFWLFLVYAFILYKAIEIGNYNLGVFAFVLSIATSFTFYSSPEPFYYVWIYKRNALQFLQEKIVIAWMCSLLIYVPFLIPLTIAFPDNIWINIGIAFCSHIYFTAIVLAKYTSFPKEMNVIQGIFLSISFLFPPLLMIVIPIFYKHAKRKLEIIL